MSSLPVGASAFVLLLLQQFAVNSDKLMPLRMVTVFFFVCAAWHTFPVVNLLLRIPHHTSIYIAVLYLFFIRHFMITLGEEAFRMLRAWKWSNRWRRGNIRSLSCAMTGLFNRCLVRAERFYAAQLVRGLAE